MTINERLAEIQTATRIENAKDTYYQAEAELVNLVGDYVMNREVRCTAFGPGKVTAYRGTALDNIIVDIQFASITKKFSLAHIITVANFVSFEDAVEIGVIWDDAMTVHTELAQQLRTIEYLERQQAYEAQKQAEADKKAAAKYEAAKAKAIRDFEKLAVAEMPTNTTEEFYYALGWLANNTGTFAAALPDYLLSYFEKHFGTDAKPAVVDSKKRTVNGYAMQWALSMKAPIKKKALDLVPSYLTPYLGKSGNAITDTAFVWDLVDNYGFQFGKKQQDLAKIRSCVPSDFVSFFEAGLKA